MANLAQNENVPLSLVYNVEEYYFNILFYPQRITHVLYYTILYFRSEPNFKKNRFSRSKTLFGLASIFGLHFIKRYCGIARSLFKNSDLWKKKTRMDFHGFFFFVVLQERTSDPWWGYIILRLGTLYLGFILIFFVAKIKMMSYIREYSIRD